VKIALAKIYFGTTLHLASFLFAFPLRRISIASVF
jgi:hypothetical protein